MNIRKKAIGTGVAALVVGATIVGVLASPGSALTQNTDLEVAKPTPYPTSTPYPIQPTYTPYPTPTLYPTQAPYAIQPTYTPIPPPTAYPAPTVVATREVPATTTPFRWADGGYNRTIQAKGGDDIGELVGQLESVTGGVEPYNYMLQYCAICDWVSSNVGTRSWEQIQKGSADYIYQPFINEPPTVSGTIPYCSTGNIYFGYQVWDSSDPHPDHPYDGDFVEKSINIQYQVTGSPDNPECKPIGQ